VLVSEIYHKQPKTLALSATVLEAVQELLKDEINGFIIIDEREKVLGVLSLQDIAAATVPPQFRKNTRMAAAMYRPGFFTDMCQQLKNTSISSLMRKDFTSVDLDDNIMAVTADFLKNDLYIVPVIEKGKLIGIITRTEIKKALLYGMRET